ncbi:hypothetical protein M405DRAFT_920956 [Rhizopogon salebrosus TDB-379]|nr:hypothetical protein M405DRAFT_920956 [Rhizopogon salebrosus TDB-379]
MRVGGYLRWLATGSRHSHDPGDHQQTMGSLDSSGQPWTALDSTTVGTEMVLSVRFWTELGQNWDSTGTALGQPWDRTGTALGQNWDSTRSLGQTWDSAGQTWDSAGQTWDRPMASCSICSTC